MRIVRSGKVMHFIDGTHECSGFEIDNEGELLSLADTMEMMVDDPDAEHVYEGQD